MRAKENEIPEPPRLFYTELVHSQLSLFSFFIDNDVNALSFLKNNLNIEGLQNVLLTIQEAYWSSSDKIKKEPKFFGSVGAVKDLLYYLHDNVAFAPFRDQIKNNSTLWEGKRAKKELDVVYLYINDFEKIRLFIHENDWDTFKFFHLLNTATVSQLLTKDSINIRVKKKYADRILFKDLSEGEQQLLTVLGLMRFTYTEEALFLLDEPDTHLNALWQWKYMQFIDEIVFKDKDKEKEKPSVQVIMSSHSPLTMGSLEKENIRRFIRDDEKLVAIEPSESPKGMGVAGILTEIFGIPSTLDIATHENLERRRHVESMIYNHEKGIPIPEDEKNSLKKLKEERDKLNEELDNLGFSRVTRDPLYQKFQAKFDKEINYRKSKLRPLTPEEIAEQDKLMEKILKELLDEEGL